MKNKNDNPITLEDLDKPVNKTKEKVDLKNYGPSYGMALATELDKEKAEESKNND
jgi:hypothetical protein|tara:strand:+ start:1321 stop:1485 length:165 start_codon:yes stop_codon:yes gene_type:complete